MTPKEKAKELIEKFIFINGNSFFAKDCAIIAVDEIIDQWDYIDTYLANLGGEFNPNLRYWQEVKTELEKL